MTLNGVIAFILLFSPNMIALLANYITVVEDRPVMFQSSIFGHNYATLQRGLSAIAELLVRFVNSLFHYEYIRARCYVAMSYHRKIAV